MRRSASPSAMKKSDLLCEKTGSYIRVRQFVAGGGMTKILGVMRDEGEPATC